MRTCDQTFKMAVSVLRKITVMKELSAIGLKTVNVKYNLLNYILLYFTEGQEVMLNHWLKIWQTIVAVLFPSSI